MEIDHEKLKIELEDKFKDRFTEKEEDYANFLKLKTVDPPCIYPFLNYKRKRFHDNNSHSFNKTRNNYKRKYD